MATMTEEEINKFLDELHIDEGEFGSEVTHAHADKYLEQQMKFDNQKFTQWAIHSGGKFSPTLSTTEKLEPGFYEVGFDSNTGHYLEKKDVNTDELYELPSAELMDIIEDIEKFWDMKKNTLSITSSTKGVFSFMVSQVVVNRQSSNCVQSS